MATGASGRCYALIACWLIVSACTAGSSSTHDPTRTIVESTSAAAAPASSAGSERSGALAAGSSEHLLLLPDDRAVLATVEDMMVGDCMRTAGFDYFPLTLERAQKSAKSSEQSFRQNFPFTPDDEGDVYDAIVPEELDRSNDDYVATLSPGEQDAYDLQLSGSWEDEDLVHVDINGGQASTPESGCLSEARKALYGSLENALLSQFFTNNLRTLALGSTQSDSRVTEGLAAWARCMGASGYSFSAFGEARSYAYKNASDAQAVADADALCVSQNRLDAVFDTVYDVHLLAATEDNAAYLEVVDEANRVALERAATHLR